MSEVESVVADLKAEGATYRETVRAATMSVGVYVLAAGAEDRQTPHTEDEVYFVVRGRGSFRAGSIEHAVELGTTRFVPAGEPHRFHHIEEELVLLVVFAPPERPTG
ncbi:MAG: cupin domain-containing protein [Thermoplasmata archaeon]|nr:cupin domain-containing protein [Thermoplasmata archaeon]